MNIQLNKKLPVAFINLTPELFSFLLSTTDYFSNFFIYLPLTLFNDGISIFI